MTYKTEREKRQALGQKFDEMQAILATAKSEHRDLTNVEAARFDVLDAEVQGLGVVYEGRSREERVQRLDERLSQIVNPHRVANFGQSEAASEEWRDVHSGKAVRLLSKGESLTEYRIRQNGDRVPEYGIGTICRALALGAQSDLEKRALGESTASAGGYLVPAITSSQLIDAMRARSAVFQAGARVIDLGESVVNIARVATDPVAAWRNEAAAFAESDTVFDSITFTSRALGFYFKVSRELLQDAVNLDQAITNVIAGAMAAALDQGCLNGSGTAPAIKGVANITGVGSVSMGTNGAALANYDPFIDAAKLLLDANAPMPGAYVMATRTYAACAKLKQATTNAPLDKPELIRGIPFIPTTRLGVAESQGTANNASRVILGDWPQMLVGTRLPVTVSTLVERFADTGQVGYLAFARYDMQLAHAAAFAQIVGIIP
jgi:HK97 family phage major capsid protein